MDPVDCFGTLLIGVGDAGSKITTNILNNVNCDHIFINKNLIPFNDNTIVVNTRNVFYPSINKIRETFLEKKDKISNIVKKYSSIVIIGNLASTFGLAIIPVLSQMIKSIDKKETVCIVIMPFGFESRKFFKCGVSLSFLNKYVNSLVMIDNDIFLRSDNDMTMDECFKITNGSIEEIVTFSLTNYFPNKFNYLVTKENKKSLIDRFSSAVAMLTEKFDVDDISNTHVYLNTSKEKITNINDIVETSRKLFKGSEHSVQIISNGNIVNRFHIVAGVNHNLAHIYDPLNGLIPEKNILDFEPEISVQVDSISFLKDIESSINFKSTPS